MVILHHEIGHSIMKHFAGQDRLVLNHAPIRYYYMMRNSIIVARRHNEYWKYFRNNARIIYQVNRYESDRWKKNKMLLKGFFHGIIGKLGKYCD
jgi:rhamnosyltransferase